MILVGIVCISFPDFKSVSADVYIPIRFYLHYSGESNVLWAGTPLENGSTVMSDFFWQTPAGLLEIQHCQEVATIQVNSTLAAKQHLITSE